jgi:hypothetical protein
LTKTLVTIATLIALSSAHAGNYVQIEQEKVTGRNGATNSEATYLRAGKDLGNYSLGLQARTARFDTNSIASSLEATVSNKNVSVLGITPFVGVGHDFGSTSAGYNYGLVGASTGAKIGPGFAYTGIKTRVLRQNASDPKQTVGFVGYNVPVTKDVAVNVGVSRSGQDIKENGVSAGVTFSF